MVKEESRLTAREEELWVVDEEVEWFQRDRPEGSDMTTQLEINPVEKAVTIAVQNEAFRRTTPPSGQRPNARQGKGRL